MAARMRAENTVDAMHAMLDDSSDDSQAVQETPPGQLAVVADGDETASEGERCADML